MRRVIFLLPLLLLTLLWACAGYDAGYAARVLINQDADTNDYLWKDAVRVAPEAAPSDMPVRDETDRLRAALLADPDITSVERYFARGKTRAFLVWRDGALTYEWYSEGRHRGSEAAAFSVSKSVFSLMFARAVDADVFDSLDRPVTDYLPELRARDPDFERITLKDLLDMRSGIGFEEMTRFPWVNQDAPAVYYASDLARTVLNRPKISSPPGPFLYNDYAPNLNGLALLRASGETLGEGALADLWSDLRPEYPVSWSVDSKGFPWHESGLVITPIDLLRIGRAILEDGRVGDQQIAPVAFLENSFGPGESETVADFGGVKLGYRNGWWIAPRAIGPEDLIGMGRHGQILLISPATSTVMVRMGAKGNPEPNAHMAARMIRVADRLAETE